MTDVVVTVPKGRWAEWLDEGDLAYSDESMMPAGWAGDYEYGFNVGTARPRVSSGDRVYVVAYGRLRGYSTLEALEETGRFGDLRPGNAALVRRGAAVACTIPSAVPGFQGVRYRWWRRSQEIPYADWKTDGVG